jgi:hypothetical protein
MIDAGNGNYDYNSVTLTSSSGFSAFNATQLAAASLGYDWTSSGAYVYMLNGVSVSGNGCWELYTWDSIHGVWTSSSTGASDLTLAAGDVIGWVVNPDSAKRPCPVPMDPRAVAATPVKITLSTPPQNLPVGSTFTVAVQVSDAVHANGFAIEGLKYDASVIHCTEVSIGTFIPSPLFPGCVPDNVDGVVAEIACSSTSGSTDVSGSGLLAALTFQVVGYGSSNIVIGGYALTMNTPSGYTYTQNIPTTYAGIGAPNPADPAAVISSPTNGQYVYVGASVTCDGTQSHPGILEGTGAPDSIWWYNWTITPPLGSGLSVIVNPGDGSQMPWVQVLDAVGQWTVMLTVQTNPDGTNVTSSVSVVVNVLAQPAGASIDVFSGKGGVGWHNNASAFGPQELVILYANVTYNGAAANNQEVVFQIFDGSGNTVGVLFSNSGVDGLYSVEYRLPWPDDGNPCFGTWYVTATTTIAQELAVDTVWFTFDYLLETTSVVVLTSPATDSTSVVRGNQVTVSFTVRSIDTASSLLCTAVITLVDACEVPIGFYVVTGVVAKAAATSDAQIVVPGTYTFSETFTVPSWAFAGQAAANCNVLTAMPSVGGTAYCPQTSASFTITGP